MLNQEKRQILSNLLDNLTKEQIIWLNGFISAKSDLDIATPILDKKESKIKEITIIYATETGNTKKIATNFSNKLKKLKIKVKLKAVQQYNPADIIKENYLIFITSTHGEGEFPENAQEFINFLDRDKPNLSNVNYSIIGLGDSNYPLFCKAATDLEEKFSILGAKNWLKIANFDLDFENHLQNYYQNLEKSLFEEEKQEKKNFIGQISQNIILNDEGSNKEIHHIEIITDAKYQSGDSIGIKIANNAPRLYSIASAIEGEIHLTVKKITDGLCSPFLSDLKSSDNLEFYIAPNNNFRLPDANKDIIMVGAGTGIAPFRSFLQQRDEIAASGKNWLFFGEQYAKKDFLYQAELQDYLDSGLLTKLDLAFSRDQEEKIYVQ
ncbi:flavodoxin domain-containing protein, partial [Rickettsiales bacterium]|nr:flavodoxin domain-containing protein [Rickettsiales bacterium]